jgi:hypothetical protein
MLQPCNLLVRLEKDKRLEISLSPLEQLSKMKLLDVQIKKLSSERVLQPSKEEQEELDKNVHTRRESIDKEWQKTKEKLLSKTEQFKSRLDFSLLKKPKKRELSSSKSQATEASRDQEFQNPPKKLLKQLAVYRDLRSKKDVSQSKNKKVPLRPLLVKRVRPMQLPREKGSKHIMR